MQPSYAFMIPDVGWPKSILTTLFIEGFHAVVSVAGGIYQKILVRRYDYGLI